MLCLLDPVLYRRGGARWGPSSSARKNGTTGYHAQIVVKRDGKIDRETRTFNRRAAATAWIRKGEEELDAPGALDQAKTEDPTLSAGDLLAWAIVLGLNGGVGRLP